MRAHARGDDTDWERIASLYETLARLTPSPVVELNRAVAVSFARGPAAGLAIVDALLSEPSLRKYHLLPSVRGDLLAKLGRARRGARRVRSAPHRSRATSASASSSSRARRRSGDWTFALGHPRP